MATYQALGTGPVSFVDSFYAQQELPLSQVFFTPNGVDATASPLFAANGTLLPALLKQLAAQGLLTPGASPLTAASTPAITITAVQPGPSGNEITVTFASPSTAAGTVDMTVTAKEVYPGLTPVSLAAALGDSTSSATGLVYVEDQSPGQEMPAAGPAGTLSGSPTFNLAIPQQADPTQTAFTLAAANPTGDDDVQRITVFLAADSATNFTLTVSWARTAAGISLASLLTSNPFAYLVTFMGQSGPLPAAGTISLKGGLAATGDTAPVAASTSVLASS